jgi:hypothetical protein
MPISPTVLLADREVSVPRKSVFQYDIGDSNHQTRMRRSSVTSLLRMLPMARGAR